MGKFDRYGEQGVQERPWKIHPIWRGIGCLLMILIPAVSFAAASVIMTEGPGMGIKLPRDMYQAVLIQSFKLPFSLGQMVLTIGIMVLLFGMFVIVYSLVYRVAGPPRYGPTDSPPPKNVKKKKRK